MWLDLHCMSDFHQTLCKHIPDLVVPNAGKAAVGARQSMGDCELLPAHTLGGEIVGLPAIAQTEGIPELGLGERKAKPCQRPVG